MTAPSGERVGAAAGSVAMCHVSAVIVETGRLHHRNWTFPRAPPLQPIVAAGRRRNDCLQLPRRAPPEPDSRRMDKHLLIVDDDREIRTLLGDYLERQGFRVTLLADGRELERTLAERAIDLLILDLTLPGVDGLALCREVRAR